MTKIIKIHNYDKYEECVKLTSIYKCSECNKYETTKYKDYNQHMKQYVI